MSKKQERNAECNLKNRKARILDVPTNRIGIGVLGVNQQRDWVFYSMNPDGSISCTIHPNFRKQLATQQDSENISDVYNTIACLWPRAHEVGSSLEYGNPENPQILMNLMTAILNNQEIADRFHAVAAHAQKSSEDIGSVAIQVASLYCKFATVLIPRMSALKPSGRTLVDVKGTLLAKANPLTDLIINTVSARYNYKIKVILLRQIATAYNTGQNKDKEALRMAGFRDGMSLSKMFYHMFVDDWLSIKFRLAQYPMAELGSMIREKQAWIKRGMEVRFQETVSRKQGGSDTDDISEMDMLFGTADKNGANGTTHGITRFDLMARYLANMVITDAASMVFSRYQNCKIGVYAHPEFSIIPHRAQKIVATVIAPTVQISYDELRITAWQQLVHAMYLWLMDPKHYYPRLADTLVSVPEDLEQQGYVIPFQEHQIIERQYQAVQADTFLVSAERFFHHISILMIPMIKPKIRIDGQLVPEQDRNRVDVGLEYLRLLEYLHQITLTPEVMTRIDRGSYNFLTI